MRKGSSVTYLIAGAMLTLMIGVASYFPVGDLYISWLIGTNITTFILFADDKTRAKRRVNRVPEWILFLFSLLGGFMGGWLGMALLRHKTRKIPFYMVMSVATAMHLFIIALIYFGM
ncbi:MAG: DUF1294 domain-containing protein [Thermoplasmata archaeon]|nr:DUF1294 domain-containing protein [Thermoplasmata archaeon]